MYKCQSYYDDQNEIKDCTCGRCGDSKSTEERLSHALDALVSVSLDLGKQAKVMTLADVHTPQAIPDNVKLEIALKPYKDKVLWLFDQELAKRVEGAYLSCFSYVDWETGDDDKLRIGDYINCNHQEPVNGYGRNFEGQIAAHHVNGVPVVLCDVDPKEPDSSGHYEDLQSLMMNGWEFSRLATLNTQTKEDN